jgi:hypothetical protein
MRKYSIKHLTMSKLPMGSGDGRLAIGTRQEEGAETPIVIGFSVLFGTLTVPIKSVPSDSYVFFALSEFHQNYLGITDEQNRKSLGNR